MPNFDVTVQRMAICVVETIVNVDAETKEEAVADALEQTASRDNDFVWAPAEDSPSLMDQPPWASEVDDGELAWRIEDGKIGEEI